MLPAPRPPRGRWRWPSAGAARAPPPSAPPTCAGAPHSIPRRPDSEPVAGKLQSRSTFARGRGARIANLY
eukprot:1091331-Prorocentrum_minimum.AAC.1